MLSTGQARSSCPLCAASRLDRPVRTDFGAAGCISAPGHVSDMHFSCPLQRHLLSALKLRAVEVGDVSNWNCFGDNFIDGGVVGMVIVSMMATAMVFAAAFEVIAHPSFRRG